MVYNIKGANPAEVDIDIKAGEKTSNIFLLLVYIKENK
jgi:hypothetical protein